MLKQKKLWLIPLGLLTLLIIYGISWLIITDALIRKKFANKSFSQPTQFYSSSYEIILGQNFNEDTFFDLLEKQEYREKPWGSVLQPSDYTRADGESCDELYQGLIKCYAFYNHQTNFINIFGTDEQERIRAIVSVNPHNNESTPVRSLTMFPQLFAQYFGASPVLQTPIPLSKIPRQCLDATLAVEDPDFLEHSGISWRGFFRALLVNIQQMRFAQGGSTITQQLVKNHFLTAERTISRKLKEMIMATLVEFRIPKDEILNTYLNIIYLGQQGNFQIRGFQSASQFYFQKNLEDLKLSECALLAAIVNNPGLYNPFKKQENALKRREKVLKAMLEQNRILKDDFEQAMTAELPTRKSIEVRETAPYFIGGVKDQLQTLGFNDLSGYKIYTTINLFAQAQAQKAVQQHIRQLEEKSKYHIENKKHSLQAVLVASNPKTGEVQALVGGRSHKKTQYNRVLESSRQVGSVFKPIVYLTALLTEPGFNPMTPLNNAPFTYEYDNQSWSPTNYDEKFSGPVPAFYALKESMNVPTARLGVRAGLENIIQTARDLGIESELKPFPSLSLGAFELKPFEVLRAYTNIARFGNRTQLRMVRRVENQDGELIFEPQYINEQILSEQKIATLISMMKETMRTGTGKAARAYGFNYDSAGKTGTTSGYKDAWFAGFTPNHVAIVWTGYDDNTPVKLSGASGALPIWASYMKSMSTQFLNSDFSWPVEDQDILSLSKDDLLGVGVPEDKAVPTELIVYD